MLRVVGLAGLVSQDDQNAGSGTNSPLSVRLYKVDRPEVSASHNQSFGQGCSTHIRRKNSLQDFLAAIWRASPTAQVSGI